MESKASEIAKIEFLELENLYLDILHVYFGNHLKYLEKVKNSGRHFENGGHFSQNSHFSNWHGMEP